MNYEAYADGDFFYIDIKWGDWKHEHRRADYLVSTFLENNVEINAELLYAQNVTQENGSDCYSALHIYKLIKKS